MARLSQYEGQWSEINASTITRELKTGLFVQRRSECARYPLKPAFIGARWSQWWRLIDVHESEEKPALGYSNSQLSHLSCSSMQGHVVYL